VIHGKDRGFLPRLSRKRARHGRATFAEGDKPSQKPAVSAAGFFASMPERASIRRARRHNLAGVGVQRAALLFMSPARMLPNNSDTLGFPMSRLL